jgi:xylan 1,4-beta-xylosidase
MPEFACDLLGRSTPLEHYWEHTVGSGHAPLALRADWQAQLKRAHEELGFRHVRFHGLLSEPMGTLVTHADEFLYSFFNADQIIDFLLSTGMRPFMELSFMPVNLASGSKTVFHYRSNVTPPRDYDQWSTLIHKLVKHWVERYGIQEASRWFLEVWNEPNLEHFWTGKQDDYFKLYRHTVEPIKEIDPSLRVGGPATAQTEWVEEFLDFCEKEDLPADFVSTHYYPTDAFGEVGAETEKKLAGAPLDIMRQRAELVHGQARGRPVYFTEWNIASNPRHHLHDEPFAAAFVTRIVMGVRGFVDGYSYWTFSDIFEENYFPSMPFHGGFGLLTLHGIAKPVYRAFLLLHNLGDEHLAVNGQHDTVAVWGARKDYVFTFLVINQNMPGHPIHTELVDLVLANSPEPLAVFVERIDEDHANPKKKWDELGKPEYLSSYEVDMLKAVSEMTKQPLGWSYDQGTVRVQLSMPPQSVAAVTLELGVEGIQNVLSGQERISEA